MNHALARGLWGRAAENKDDACCFAPLNGCCESVARETEISEREEEGVSEEDNIREKRSVLRARRQPNSVATSFVMLRNELVEKHPFCVHSLNK